MTTNPTDIVAGLFLCSLAVAVVGIAAWLMEKFFDLIGGKSLLDPRKKKGGR